MQVHLEESHRGDEARVHGNLEDEVLVGKELTPAKLIVFGRRQQERLRVLRAKDIADSRPLKSNHS